MPQIKKWTPTHAQRRREERRDAVRMGMRAQRYLRQLFKIADEAKTALPVNIPALRLRADIYTRALAKVLPDLKAVEVTGDQGQQRVIVVPVATLSAEEWAAQVRQERERGLLPGVVIEQPKEGE